MGIAKALHQATRVFGGLVDGIVGTNFVGDYDAQRNYERELEQQSYERDLQQQLFTREDTAVQRRTADMVAAGQNPLLAAGGAAGAGSVVSSSAPQHSTAKYDPLNKIAAVLSMEKSKADISRTVADTRLTEATMRGVENQNRILKANADKAEHDLNIINDEPGVPSDTPWYGRALIKPFNRAKSLMSEWSSNYSDLRKRGYSVLKSAGFY